ncbi:MAG: hypothetical protein RR142_10110 [Clostridia bacterium]
MISMPAAQVNAFAEMRLHSAHPFFLHVCKDADALWVSDFPRKEQKPEKTLEALACMHIQCHFHEHSCLWYMDWTLDGYAQAMQGLPTVPPALPKEGALHLVYAFCRLLLAHPAPLEAEPLEILREVLKLVHRPQNALLQAIPALHEACAQRLRVQKSLPYSAGRVLAQWLLEKER